MRHDLAIQGKTCRLRPITDADAALVLELRGDPRLNRFLHTTSSNLEDQLSWFAEYYERPGDYYFVVERLAGGAPEGVISIYNVDPEARTGEWGRWVLRPSSLAAVESAWLIYRCAFELLGLEEAYCRTNAENESVVSFHDSCEIVRRTRLPDYFSIDGRTLDAIEHRVDRADWRDLAPRLERMVALIAGRMRHG